MVQPVNTTNFAKSTGRSWDEWLAFLEAAGAKNLSHKDIAQRIYDTGDATGWWSQSVAVAYEQHIGRRIPGQKDQGFTVSASKTCAGTMDDVMARWTAFIGGTDSIDGVAISRGPETSDTGKYRNWRCGLADGSRVVVGLSQKAPDKVVLAVAHEKLDAAEKMDPRRAYWKGLLAGFA
jgi:hypothetical protein